MQFNFWTFLFQLLNFVVLAYVLRRLLYRPLSEAIERRRQEGERARTEAEQARQDAESLRKRLQGELAEIERQRQQVVHDAHERAEAERHRLLAAAADETRRHLDEARRAREQERTEALESLRDEVVHEAVSLAGRLLGESAERSLHEQLALRLCEALETLPAGERARIREGERVDGHPDLECADELTPATLSRLTDIVAQVVGHPVTLDVRRRTELLGGVRLRMAGQVWDSSLAGQLAAPPRLGAKEGA